MTKVAAPTQPCPTSVYLYFDRFDILVYVGVTSRGIARQREHNADKDWWAHVVRQEVEHFPNRTQALSREQELIALMSPPFNSIHNPDRDARAAYLALVATGPASEPENKWIPMRVGFQRDDLLIVLTRMEYANAVAAISTDTGFIVGAAGFKVRDVAVRRIGSALAVAMRVKGAPPCDGARLKYKHIRSHAGGGYQIKQLDLVFDVPTRLGS